MTPVPSRDPNRSTAVLVALAVLASGATMGASIAGAMSQQQDQAGLRVVHASPDAPPVDVYLDNRSVLTNVTFGTVSEYLNVQPGTHTVTITAAGNRSAVVFRGDVDLRAGTNYTLAAAGEVSEDAETSFGPVVMVDNATQPGENQAAVRLAHLSPDAPAVDVTIAGSGDVLYDNVSYRNVTDYMRVPAGNYTLEIRPATQANDGEVVATFNVSLEGGTAYTAFAVGYLNPDAAPADTPFDLLVASDATTDGRANETEAGMTTPS